MEEHEEGEIEENVEDREKARSEEQIVSELRERMLRYWLQMENKKVLIKIGEG